MNSTGDISKQERIGGRHQKLIQISYLESEGEGIEGKVSITATVVSDDDPTPKVVVS